MTNDEIKKALISKCLIIHHDKKSGVDIVYGYAQAWRVCVDVYGDFISSLELVKNQSVTIAKADECEIAVPDKKVSQTP
ncbi:MAG: hypothetical protein IKU25_09370 [Clostridia bacterium]|nr:hypothetical protein [Clostridia bacterium]